MRRPRRGRPGEAMRTPTAVSSITLAVMLATLCACAQPNPPVLGSTAATGAASEEFDDCGGAGWCPRMVIIPAGRVTVGSPDAAGDQEGTQRVISIPQRFAASRYEVTVRQYGAFVAATGHVSAGRVLAPGETSDEANVCWTADPLYGEPAPDRRTWQDPGFAQGDDHPVVCVSWIDAQAYIRWLNAQTTGGYRLLSEAEWEYAAGGETSVAHSWETGEGDICRHANGTDISHTRSSQNALLSVSSLAAMITRPTLLQSARIFPMHSGCMT